MSIKQIETTLGSTVDAELAWTDDDGNPIDLTGATLSVPTIDGQLQAEPAALAGVQLTITDAAGGIAELVVPAEVAAALPLGLNSWLRISLAVGDDSIDNSEQIWIMVE